MLKMNHETMIGRTNKRKIKKKRRRTNTNAKMNANTMWYGHLTVAIFVLVFILRIDLSAAKYEDWTQCIVGCSCKSVDGRKQANCVEANLKSVPDTLSDEIQVLNLDRNAIRSLKQNVFRDVGLVNLQKLSLRECRIQDVNRNAFAGLSLVINIDLSANEIDQLDPSTFSQTVRLRHISLNANNLQHIDDGLFRNLEFLQKVDLNDNKIVSIARNAFSNLQALTSLKLKGNQLVHLEAATFETLPKLTYLEIQNNPWRCDCHLRGFFARLHSVSVATPVYCNEPENMQNRTWDTINADDFACRPLITWPNFHDTLYATEGNDITLSCRVTGDPKPQTHWTFDGRPLNNRTVVSLSPTERKYTDHESEDTTTFWYNVTVRNFGPQDRGVYTCVATNAAGIAEKKVNVQFGGGSVWFGGPTASNGGDVFVLLLCLVVGIVCALVFVFLLCFVCCRRAETMMAKKPPSSNVVTNNGDVTHHRIATETEQQKTLLTAVNPVQKPPRKYDSSPLSERAATELNELSRSLLDDHSIRAGTSVAGDSTDDRRSTNSLEQMFVHSQDNLLLHDRAARLISRTHHPPDLLAFPNHRAAQASPIGSISNDRDGSAAVTRLHHLHSPMRSPIYQTNMASMYSPTYETIPPPYSRTQSPFSLGIPSASGTPIIAHRQGYVTIPRRPRVPSWSNASTPVMDDPLGYKSSLEPVYDNLGPRTTADGSSVLSLPRRIAAESPVPRAGRPQPGLYSSHTLPHKTKLNHGFLPKRESREPHFHPVNEAVITPGATTGGVIRPLPLQFSQLANNISTVSAPLMSQSEDVAVAVATPPQNDRRRTSWVTPRQPPETGVLRKPPPATADSPKPVMQNDDTGVETLSKVKVPPKPPPKPKKNGPLFEDEGEDGTEV